MEEWLENIVLMIAIIFLAAIAIPAGIAEDGERREGRLYTKVPDLVVTHVKVGDFDMDGTCDGMRIYYKNKGGMEIPIDGDGFMASVVINDLYSRGYAGIYDERVDLPPELEEIDPDQEFYELISYKSLLIYGFKQGKDNKVRVVVDTRDNIHELREDNNEAVFNSSDDACRDGRSDDDYDGNDEDSSDVDNTPSPDTGERSCRIAGMLFEHEQQEFTLGKKSIEVEFLETDDGRAVFRVGETLVELKEGYTKAFPEGMVTLKGLGMKENRRYAVFVVGCKDDIEQKEGFTKKAEYDIRRREDVCDGCKKDDGCLGIGLRLIQDKIPSFCDVDGSLAPQKGLDAACQNDYECQSNTCQSGACIDLPAQRAAKTSLLERILAWFEKLFR